METPGPHLRLTAAGGGGGARRRPPAARRPVPAVAREPTPPPRRPRRLSRRTLIVVVVAIVAVVVVLVLTTGLATDVRTLIADVAKWVEHLFAVYGYPIVFLAVLGESAGLPLPGETILIIAGVAAQHGDLALPIVWLLGATAAIVGDNIGYWVGHYGGRPLLERYGRLLRVHERELRILDRYFEVHGAKTVFLGRFVIFLRVWAALFAGAARMNWKRFFVYNALGGTAWVVSMSSLAYIFSSSISRLKGVFGVIAWVLAFVVAGFVVVFVAREQRKSLEKYAREDDEAEGTAAPSSGAGPPMPGPPRRRRPTPPRRRRPTRPTPRRSLLRTRDRRPVAFLEVVEHAVGDGPALGPDPQDDVGLHGAVEVGAAGGDHAVARGDVEAEPVVASS